MKIRQLFVASVFAVWGAVVLAASTIIGSVQLPAGSYASSAVDPVLHRFFAANTTTGKLTAVDVDSMQVVGEAAIDAGAAFVRVDAAHHRVYILHGGSPGQITTVDGKTMAIIARTTIADKPSDLSMDLQRGEIYVIHDEADHHVTIFNTKTNTVAATLQLGAYMYGIAVDRVNGKIYVSQYGAKQVAVISQSSRTVVKSIPVAMYPLGVTADEKYGNVFIGGLASTSATAVDLVAVIDPASDTVRTTLEGMVLTMPNVGTYAPTIAPVYARAYFSTPAQGKVTLVDSTYVGFNKSVAVTGNPYVARVNPDDGEVYVADALGSATITVLDARQERVIGTMNLGLLSPSINIVGGRLVLFGRDAAGNRKLVSATPYGIQPDTVIATDFHHAGFDHYFHSASGEETRALQDGIFDLDWIQTQQLWRVWRTPGAERFPVCRFFSSGFGTRSSHFYTPYASECEGLKKGTTWTYEETSYYVALPDATGTCGPAYEELYRLYNNGMGGAPNHAYTNSRTKRDALQASGWTPEGSGSQNVFACTPPLKGFLINPQ